VGDIQSSATGRKQNLQVYRHTGQAESPDQSAQLALLVAASDWRRTATPSQLIAFALLASGWGRTRPTAHSGECGFVAVIANMPPRAFKPLIFQRLRPMIERFPIRQMVFITSNFFSYRKALIVKRLKRCGRKESKKPFAKRSIVRQTKSSVFGY
jgi:hypothetical protein